MSFLSRLKVAHKAHSVRSIVLGAFASLAWPMIEAASQGVLGEDAKPWAICIIAVAGIFGFAVPQASVSKADK